MSNKHSQSVTKSNTQKIADHQLVTHVMQTAVDAALLKHKQAGHPICIWQDGKVVWIPAAEIFAESALSSLPKDILDKIHRGENAIRIIRKYRGLTQAALATQVQVSKQYISQLEKDEKTGSIHTVQKIAEALNVRLEDLISQRQ